MQAYNIMGKELPQRQISRRLILISKAAERQIIVIDPRKLLPPIKPPGQTDISATGKDVALALAICRVLIDSGSADNEFISKYVLV
ncbi:MAG: hypothetical protein R2744_01445 [Bacteroidales bacterium]